MELVEVPVLGELARAVRGDRAGRSASSIASSACSREVFAVEDLLAAPVDHLALLVHHLVVLEDVLADLEVAVLDGALRALDRLRDHLRLERHVVGERAVHHPVHRAGREQAHEVVFERQVEAALARVALAARATAELVVDAAALVALGAEHVEAAELADLVALVVALLAELARRAPRSAAGSSSGVDALGEQLAAREALGVAAEEDVDAATGHVGGDGDRVRPAGLRDDVRLPLVLLGVEHRVRDAAPLEQAGRAAPTSRPRSCRRAPAGPSRSAPGCRRRRRRTSRPRSCR